MKMKYFVLALCMLSILLGIFYYVQYHKEHKVITPVSTNSVQSNTTKSSTTNNLSYKGISYVPDLNWVQDGTITGTGNTIIDLTDTSFSTVHLRYVWAQLNPQKGVYDFTVLDKELTQVAAAGKKVTIVVSAGKWTPSWVYDIDGAEKFSIPVDQSKAKANFAQSYIPVVWDTKYLGDYGVMIDALSKHLHAVGLYDTVALVKVSGINIASAEMRLYQPKVFSDAITDVMLCNAWVKQGYSEDKILEATKSLANSVSIAFPDKQLGMAFVIGGGRFPSVVKGSCSVGANNDTVGKMIRTLSDIYGTRIVTDSTVLYWGENGKAPNGYPEMFAQYKLPIAFQFDQQQIGCSNQDKPATGSQLIPDELCSAAEVQASLNDAVKYKAAFVEVFPQDVLFFKAILDVANKTLQSL